MSPMFKRHRSFQSSTSLSSITLADLQQHMLEQFIFQLVLQFQRIFYLTYDYVSSLFVRSQTTVRVCRSHSTNDQKSYQTYRLDTARTTNIYC